MTASLAWKELRESLPLVLVAAAAELCLLGTAMRFPFLKDFGSPHGIPFLADDVCLLMFFAAGGLAIGLGLLQTLAESGRGTWTFLLHRPAQRSTIFGTKLCVGGALSLAAYGVPLGLYALWAAMPGTHASPFEWSMTLWAWGLCAQLPLIYLAAFLSGLWPGRWYVSRLLPLAGAILLVVALQIFLFALPALATAGMAMVLLAEAAYVLAILYVVANRDFS